LTPEGGIKSLDFGVAGRFSMGRPDEATLTMATLSEAVNGTPAYMAPEVLMQKPYDGRADLFSMGLVYYEMLGGPQPFETDSIAGTMASVLHTEPPPIEQLNPKVSANVSFVVQTMLAKDPVQRYSTARDVLVDLRRVQEGEKPVFARSKKRTSNKVNWKVGVAIAAVALVVAIGFLVRSAIRNGVQGAGSSSQVSGEKSATLVVLPFQAASGDAKLTAFGNGLVDTLTAKLMQFGGNHPLQVVSGAEVRQKNVTALRQARQEFGADTVLHFELQQSGDLVRVA